MSETTDRNPHEVDPHLTATIVRSYVRNHAVGTGQVSELITSVHGALAQLGRPNQPEEVRTPAVSKKQSVRRDYVVCLDCGHRGKTLLNHINKQHGLSRYEYLERWGLRRDHPLTAPAYSEQRSAMAKELGFGRKATRKPAPAAAPIASASANTGLRSAEKSARRRGNGSASKSDVVSQAAAAPPPARKRGSRVAPRG